MAAESDGQSEADPLLQQIRKSRTETKEDLDSIFQVLELWRAGQDESGHWLEVFALR